MSVIKHNKQRVAVFIDTQNLYHSAKNIYNSKVNFGNILTDAVADRNLIRAIAYVISTEGGEEKNFFDALLRLGIETKTKDLQIFSGGAKKGDWDIGMAVDAIVLASKVDTIVLVTGDGDFCPLVEYLRINRGCQVEVISFKRSTSSRLIEMADDFVDLDADPKRYLLYTRERVERGDRGAGRLERKVPTSRRRSPAKSSTGASQTKEPEATSSIPEEL